MKTRAPLESAITTAILRAINALPDTYAVKLHGSQFSRVGTPDILVVRLREGLSPLEPNRVGTANAPLEPRIGRVRLDDYGQAYFLEVKRPGQKPTPAQLAEMARWTGVGAVCCVVRTVQEAMEAVG